MVTFYVDEEGHVRLPSVDSAESPALIRNAFIAVKQWRFVPPTIHGKPALVFTGRSVGFYVRDTVTPPKAPISSVSSGSMPVPIKAN